MPIADCGFPAIAVVPGSNPPQFISGSTQLAIKGPTVAVEIGFDPGRFHPDPAEVLKAKLRSTLRRHRLD